MLHFVVVCTMGLVQQDMWPFIRAIVGDVRMSRFHHNYGLFRKISQKNEAASVSPASGLIGNCHGVGPGGIIVGIPGVT